MQHHHVYARIKSRPNTKSLVQMEEFAITMAEALPRWWVQRLRWYFAPQRANIAIGFDLAGNTYWEFKDALISNRFRRIVQYSGTHHLSDVQVTPSWMQWLRHTRTEAPSIPEQKTELIRQERIRLLAAQADERWKSKPSVLDRPDKQQPPPALGLKDPGGYAPQTEPEDKQGVRNAAGTPQEVIENVEGKEHDKGRFKGETKQKTKEDPPWMQKSVEWQPEPWNPQPARRR